MQAVELKTYSDFSLLDMIEYPVVVVTNSSEVIYANDAVSDLFNSDYIHGFLSEIIHCEDGTEFKPGILLLNRRQPIRCIYEKDEKILYLDVYIKASKQKHDKYFIVSFVDVTAYVEREQALFKEATIDSLTSIYNRRHFFFQFENELKRAERENTNIALLLFDIDYFKRVNDAYGHSVGDRVLQIVTRVIKQELRDIDIFGRIGGEEFGVVLPRADQAIALSVANRVRQVIKKTEIALVPEKISITLSVGIVSTAGKANSDLLMVQADDALYVAKNSGRDAVICHS